MRILVVKNEARLPIRWRLTLWYAALLTAALGLFGLGLYIGLRQVLYGTFDEQLHSDMALARSAVRVEGDRITLDPDAVASLRSDERFIRVIATDGSVVVDTGTTVGGVPVDPILVRDALAGTTQTTSVRGEEATMGIVTAPVRSGDAIIGVLQVGLSREDIDDVLQILLVIFGVLAPIVLVVAAGGGYLLAGRALAPVAAITDLAAGIGGDDLRARLNLDLPDDELGRLARTFDGMLARIEDAFERQRRFTGDAAHELRTPLSLMRSQVDLALARPRSEEEYREALRGLDHDVERLTDLVGSLLTLARADSGRLPLDRAPMDLAEPVAAILDQYASCADEVGITLLDESSSAPLVGDGDLLIQLLVNLLDNAFVHTPAGGQIAVGCRAEGDRVRLWVADTGQGIPPEHQPRVFDRFFRVDSGRARERGGIGLGLAICRAVAEAHGGTIGLISEPGEGTRVELVLPRG